MGRRALRRIDPTLDLSRHLKTLDALPKPCDCGTLFAADQPLEVEVGSGKGLFLTTASGEHADRNFLGCEVSRKYARFAAAKLLHAQRANAVIVHGDAMQLFAEVLPDQCATAVHVYFPDPWWKKRHRRRRIMNELFVRQVERVLRPLGRLHFWTDVPEYFQVTLETMASATRLEGPFAVSEQGAEHDLDYRTHFERRMRMHAVEVFRAEFQRPLESA